MRLFIALEPTRAFRSALSELQDRLCSAGVAGRYLEPSNLHLTLAFVGEWPEDITPLLPAVGASFPVALSHIGIFERARVLWAGIEPSDQLNRLAAHVRRNLDAAAVPYDRQAFNPHITLIRKPVLPREETLPQIREPHAVMNVREVCLYRSDHIETGMRYTVIGRSGRGNDDGMAF